MEKSAIKSLIWMGSSRKDMRECPDDVRREMGLALFVAQSGLKPEAAKPLKGFGSANVLEIVSDHQTDTYRAVYTVQFEDVIYVLHVFQKKSKHGKQTPKPELALIKVRLKQAKLKHESS